MSIAWFFASTQPEVILRETVAMGEERTGNHELAATIRQGGQLPPENQTNLPPIAAADSYQMARGTSLSRTAAQGVSANDVDPNGDLITAQVVSNVSNGTLTLNADGSFQYVPTADFVGTDQFSYRLSDGKLTSNTVQVTIDVEAPVNTFSIDENSATGTVVGRVALGDGKALSYAVQNDDLADDLQLRPDDHITGDPTSPLVLIEYLDLQCPNCKSIHPTVEGLEEDFDGELLIVRRHFPLNVPHPNAFGAAVAAEAAGRQGKFDEMVDILFDNQDEWSGESNPESFFEDYADQIGLDVDQFADDYSNSDVANRVRRNIASRQPFGRRQARQHFTWTVKKSVLMTHPMIWRKSSRTPYSILTKLSSSTARQGTLLSPTETCLTSSKLRNSPYRFPELTSTAIPFLRRSQSTCWTLTNRHLLPLPTRIRDRVKPL